MYYSIPCFGLTLPNASRAKLRAASSPALVFLVIFLVITAGGGCRRAAPPAFTPAPEVVELTNDIEDPEELKLYMDLQAQIAQTLRKLTGTPENPIHLGQEAATARLKLGYSLYSRQCVQCHGVNGDGQGPAAEYLDPKPRNYTHGVFKFISTPYGKKPRRSDLVRTIRRGITGTSMPSFDRFSEEEVEALVDYALFLTWRGELERQLASIVFNDGEFPDDEYLEEVINEVLTPWQESANQLVMPVSPMPPMTDESVLAGHQLFLQHACNKCHGKYGRGGSVEKVDVGVDSWGNKAAAADLSSGMFRGGDRPIDIYRRISSGINGTPMPAFEQFFKDDPEAIWHLVHFIRATGERRRQGKPPLGEADLPTEIPSTTEPRQPAQAAAPDSERSA